MKIPFSLLFTVAALFLGIGAQLTSCSISPSSQVAEYQTLKAVGHIAEAAVATTAQLYGGGQITSDQARRITEFYDGKFQPVYRLAVTAAGSNLNSPASPDVAALAGQLANLVLAFANTPTPK